MKRIMVLVTVVALLVAMVALTAGGASAKKEDQDNKNRVSICHYTGKTHGYPYEGVPVIKEIEVKKKHVTKHLAHGDFLVQQGPGWECQFGG